MVHVEYGMVYVDTGKHRARQSVNSDVGDATPIQGASSRYARPPSRPRTRLHHTVSEQACRAAFVVEQRPPPVAENGLELDHPITLLSRFVG